MTEAEVADKVWEWLGTVTGVPIIYAYQGAEEPASAYGVLNLTLANAVHEHAMDAEFEAEGAGDDEVVTQVDVHEWFWRFSLNAYGEGGMTILRKVQTARHRAGAQEALAPLVLFETSQIRDATELVNEEFRARAQMDIEFRGLVRDGEAVDIIEDAPVETARI